MTQNQQNIVSRYAEIIEMWPESVTDAALAEILLQLAPERVPDCEAAARIVAELRKGMEDGRSNGCRTMQFIDLEQSADEWMRSLCHQVPEQPVRCAMLCDAYNALAAEMGMQIDEAEMGEFRNADESVQWSIFTRLLDQHSRRKAVNLLGFPAEPDFSRSRLTAKHIPMDESEMALALAVWLESGDASPRDVGEQSGRTRALVEKIVEDGEEDPDHVVERIVGGLSLATLGVLGFVKSEIMLDALLAFTANIEGEIFVLLLNILSAYTGFVILGLVVAAGLAMAGGAINDWRARRKAQKNRAPGVQASSAADHSAPDVSR